MRVVLAKSTIDALRAGSLPEQAARLGIERLGARVERHRRADRRGPRRPPRPRAQHGVDELGRGRASRLGRSLRASGAPLSSRSDAWCRPCGRSRLATVAQALGALHALGLEGAGEPFVTLADVPDCAICHERAADECLESSGLSRSGGASPRSGSFQAPASDSGHALLVGHRDEGDLERDGGRPGGASTAVSDGK